MANQKVLYIIIIILLLVLAGIGINSLYKNQIAKAQQEGYNVGVTQSVYSLVQQSRSCKPVSMFIGNQTFEFIDTACLQQAVK